MCIRGSHNIETPARRDAIFRDVAAGHRVDGLIIISLSPTDDDVGRWAGADVPVVLVDTSQMCIRDRTRLRQSLCGQATLAVQRRPELLRALSGWRECLR